MIVNWILVVKYTDEINHFTASAIYLAHICGHCTEGSERQQAAQHTPLFKFARIAVVFYQYIFLLTILPKSTHYVHGAHSSHSSKFHTFYSNKSSIISKPATKSYYYPDEKVGTPTSYLMFILDSGLTLPCVTTKTVHAFLIRSMSVISPAHVIIDSIALITSNEDYKA
jgi:hypothetical protein